MTTSSFPRRFALASLFLTLTLATDPQRAYADSTKPKAPPRFANVNPNDDDVVAPPASRPDCYEALEAAGVRYKKANLKVHKRGKLTCGVPEAIVYLEGPTGVRYSPTPTVSCDLGLALAHFEKVMQEEAQQHLDTTISTIKHLGTYNCRKMARFDLMSEHSYANGIDLAEFSLKNRKKVSVLRHFQATAEAPTTPSAQFLRNISQRGYDEGVFSVVVTEYFDRLHKNHIHVDLARYRVDGSR